MVYTLYISGTKFSGKTALCLGLFNKFNEMGMKVGYFKPVGQGHKAVEGKLQNPDVLMKKDVIGLSEPLEELCPVVLGSHYLDLIGESCLDSRNRVLDAYRKVREGKDVLIIEAAQTPELLSCSSLDLSSLSKEFGAKVIFSIKGDNDSSADKALLYRDYLTGKGVDFLGVVLNFLRLSSAQADGREQN